MLVFSELSIRRGERLLLENFSGAIHAGHKVGITGRNGTGKSTLFALIRGELAADSGDFQQPQRLKIAHLAQETPALAQRALDFVMDGDTELRRVQAELRAAEKAQDLTAQARAHEVLHAIDGYTAEARAARLLSGLGFAKGDEDRSVADFSGGWRMRLNLAQCLMARSDLLLLDEPTNHLDLDTVLWLSTELQRYAGTLLVISHDRDFLDVFTTHTLHMERLQATIYSGNYSSCERQRAEQMAQRTREYEAQKKRLAHLEKFVTRFKAKASKARQAQSRVKQIEKIQLVEPAHWASPFSFAFRDPERLPSPMMKVEHLRAGYDPHSPVLDGVRFSLEPGDRIGVLGRNGAGKSTLIKTIAGSLAPIGGKMQCDDRLRVGYFHQHQVDALEPEKSAMAHLSALAPDKREQELRDYLGGFDFRGDRVFDPVGPFSGGEKARLALALLVWQRPNLLLMDEPTNHLDLEMRHALELALLEFTGAMILVAHDRHLLSSCSDEFWLVSNGEVSTFDGDIDDYERWLSRETSQQDAAPGDESAASASVDASVPVSAAERRRLAAAQREREKPLRHALKSAEREMERQQQALDKLQTQLADPALYVDAPERARELAREQGECRKALSEAEANWLSAAEALESARAE